MSAHTPEDQTLIQDRDQLVEFMLARVKPSSEWVIGTEHEKIGYSLNSQKRPTFEGEIGELLSALEREGWRANSSKARRRQRRYKKRLTHELIRNDYSQAADE